MSEYRVVCVTPAGRRRYMRYLVPQVLASPAVDRYDIWVNTTDVGDLAFLEEIGLRFSRVRLIPQPEGCVRGNASINAFFRQATDPDTIYVRLDDDIVWMEPGLVEKLVAFRLANPDYFLVSPLVINNALCTHLLQASGHLTCFDHIPACSSGEIAWKSGTFAEQLHRWFLGTIEDVTWKHLRCQATPIALNRFSINAISWFGRTFRAFDGTVLGDEEEFVSVIKPAELGLANCFHGGSLVAHFAFHTQRRRLDRTNLLEKYGRAVSETHGADDAFCHARQQVEEAIERADSIVGKGRSRDRLLELKRAVAAVRVPTVRLTPISELRARKAERRPGNRLLVQARQPPLGAASGLMGQSTGT